MIEIEPLRFAQRVAQFAADCEEIERELRHVRRELVELRAEQICAANLRNASVVRDALASG